MALRIDNRLFCTQQCLLGLAYSGDLDDRCPNLGDHKGRHISPNTFLSLIRTQLTNDRGRGANYKPLYIKGSRGALFKVRLSLHGYMLVAKGIEKVEQKYLIHESKVYDHLRLIQGSHIPVSLGIVNLDLPYYYNAGVYFSMLFLSWADQVNMTLRELYVKQVLHRDVEPRNWLWDKQKWQSNAC